MVPQHGPTDITSSRFAYLNEGAIEYGIEQVPEVPRAELDLDLHEPFEIANNQPGQQLATAPIEIIAHAIARFAKAPSRQSGRARQPASR